MGSLVRREGRVTPRDQGIAASALLVTGWLPGEDSIGLLDGSRDGPIGDGHGQVGAAAFDAIQC